MDSATRADISAPHLLQEVRAVSAVATACVRLGKVLLRALWTAKQTSTTVRVIMILRDGCLSLFGLCHAF